MKKKKLSKTSSSKHILDKYFKSNINALKDSASSNDFCYVENNINANDNKRKEKRAIIWFNSPIAKRAMTTLGKTFLQLLSKHFPKREF